MLFSALLSLLLASFFIWSGPFVVATPIVVSRTPPVNASQPIPESFVSYSLEFAFFPDFAGNSSSPNKFSLNLLNNLGNIQGTNPIIRVGGNTQDYPLYNASLPTATYGIYNSNKSSDYPTTLFIGPEYFDSYSTWPNTTFIHGFNLAKNGSIGYNSLLATVPLVCKALEGGKLAYWELGNEPDLYKTSAQGAVRPASWNEQDYVDEWLYKTRAIKKTMAATCPDLTTDAKYKYIAPSFAGTSNSLDPIRTWHDGLDTDHDISLISSHNYIGGATQPGVTLQGTLMNHSSTVASIAHHVNESNLLANYSIPFILGETNSLYNEGAPGLSNAFGAALWGVDFNLWCASVGIRRVHMHQGLNYRYASWQPHDTVNVTTGTKAPYYGNIAVANMMGDLTKSNVSIANIPMPSIYEAAYAAYVDDRLARIAIINMVEYNYTGPASASAARPSATYSFEIPRLWMQTSLCVQRLMANGSNAITGITWDGISYNWELDNGKPVSLANVTTGETVQVASGGEFSVQVPYSSMAMLSF